MARVAKVCSCITSISPLRALLSATSLLLLSSSSVYSFLLNTPSMVSWSKH